jgi:hypothetical protein
MPKKTANELPSKKTPVSRRPAPQAPFSDAKGTPVKPDSKPWIHNRVSDHDKSERERGRH